MLNIAPNTWIAPDHIEEVQLDKDALLIYMISGRMHYITNGIGEIMKEIEDFMNDVAAAKQFSTPKVEEVKPKRKYTKRVKEDKVGETKQ